VSVYVGVSMWPFGRMVMCHMVADSEAELDEMAGLLNLRPAWKQDNPKGRKPGTVGALVHYDIGKGKRAQAVRLGAIPLDTLAEEAEVLERLAEKEAVRHG
jgi:hypothetical protein